MRLDKQTDYSLRALMYLAANRDRASTIAEIAGRYDVSKAHMMKVVRLLGQAGFVETARGRAGGLRLVGDGADIRVGDVVRRMERDLGVVDCLRARGEACLVARCCRLKLALTAATAAFLAVLDGYTVADLVADNDELAALLA